MVLMSVLLLKGEHMGHCQKVGRQQRALPCELFVEDEHVVWAYVAIAVLVEQIEAELKLLSVPLDHHVRLKRTQISCEIQWVHSFAV